MDLSFKPIDSEQKTMSNLSHATNTLILTSSTFLFSLALVSKKGMFICCANF